MTRKHRLKYTFFHDVHGTLEIHYPSGCTVELSGSRYHGFTLEVVPKKGIRKPKAKKQVRVPA